MTDTGMIVGLVIGTLCGLAAGFTAGVWLGYLFEHWSRELEQWIFKP